MGDWDTAGLDRFLLDLGKAGPKVEALTETAVHKTGFDTVAAAQAIAPVDTGNLKNSIGVDFDGLGFEAGPTAAYGGYVEWGTSRMSPQPYMRPAFEKALPPLEQALEQAGRRALGD